MKVIVHGPENALFGLASVDVELHGVRARHVRSGRVVSTEQGYGETKLMIYYVDGKRSTRIIALERLKKYISPGQKVELEGSISDDQCL